MPNKHKSQYSGDKMQKREIYPRIRPATQNTSVMNVKVQHNKITEESACKC